MSLCWTVDQCRQHVRMLGNEDKVHLQDIQQRRIPSHGSRVVPLELWGPEGCVECKVKFDVADVAYPVVPLGKMIESGFTFSFDDYKCYMQKGNRRVEIFRKGRIFVLRMKDKVQMVAPIEEVAAGEMEIEVRSKTDEYGVEMVIRFLSTYESVEIKTDGEPSIVEVARRVQARRDKTTTLAQTSVGGHQEIGAVERANGAVQAQLRAYFLDVQNRMQVRIIPGTQLFPDVAAFCLDGGALPVRSKNETGSV